MALNNYYNGQQSQKVFYIILAISEHPNPLLYKEGWPKGRGGKIQIVH